MSIRLNSGTATGLRKNLVYRLCLATLFILACLFLPVRNALAVDWSAFGDDYPSLQCTEAIAVDGDGNVLYTRNASTSMPMASITKVMTAVVALESGLPLDTAYTVSAAVANIGESSIGYAEGEQVTLNELMHGLLIHSGNDAALAIAECVAGSEQAFVDRMNSKAQELGMTGTHFANPHGLDADGHYSTAYDLVALARYAMEFPLIKSIVGSTSITLTVGGQPVTYASTDTMLNSYPGMQGIKTGYTYGAGRAFLGMATRGGTTIYVVILGTESDEQRFAETQTLLDWSFSHYPEKTLLSPSTSAAGYVGCTTRFGWTYATTTATNLTVRNSPFSESTPLTTDVEIGAATATGENVGTIAWFRQDGTLYASRSVYTVGMPLTTHEFGPIVSRVFYEIESLV